MKFTLIFLLFVLNISAVAQWLQTGPQGGIVNSINTSNGTVFAGTNNGVYFSFDNGTNWNTGSGNINSLFISSFAFKDNFIFAGAYRSSRNYDLYSGGVLISSDGGDTWVRNSYRQINALNVKDTNIFSGAGYIYSQQSGGIYVSGDNGSNWTSVFSDTINVYAFLQNGNNLYAGTKYGVYLTNNNGNTWNLRTNGIPASYTIFSFASNGTVLYAGTSSGVFTSTDAGLNWSTISSGLPQGIPVYSILFNNNTLFAGIFSGGIFKSTNNGTSWSRTDQGITNNLIGTLYFNQNRFYAGTLGGGIFISNDGGNNWTENNTGLNLQTIWSTLFIGDNLYAGTQGGGIYLSPDNGNSWSSMNNGLGNQIVYSIIESNNIMLAGTYGGIYRSLNFGQRWDSVNTGLKDSVILCLAAKDNFIFAGSRDSGVYISNDNGTSWFSSNSGINSDTISALKVLGNYVFAGTRTGGVFRSSDNGTSWSQVNSGINIVNPYARSFTSINNVLYCGYYNIGGGVYKSTNFGNNWVRAGYLSLPISLASSGNNLFVSDYYNLNISTDDGSNWASISSGGSQWGNRLIYSINFNQGYIFAGTDGFSLWKRQLNEIIGIKNITSTVPIGFHLFQNYPNPFNPVTAIKIDIPKQGVVKLIIYDVQGREIAVLVNQLLKPGSYEVTWDAGNEPSGIYYYRLISGNNEVSKKMVLIK